MPELTTDSGGPVSVAVDTNVPEGGYSMHELTIDPGPASVAFDADIPDGGYGWFVVGGCFVLTWWCVGTVYCWGVLQANLVETGLSTPSTLSFIQGLASACISVFGVANGYVIRRIGARLTALAGVVLLGLGQILSGFAVHQVGGLFMTSGLVAGIGTSLCFMVASVTPAQYFRSKRGIANGIVSAGGGLGGTVLSFAVNGLIQSVGIAWTFRSLGFMTLVTGIPAALLIKERVPIPSTASLDWSLFRDIRFSVLFVAGAIAIFSLFVPPFFLPLYCKALGLSSTGGAAFVAGFNFSSACGRIICGLASDVLGPFNTFLATLVLSFISMLVIWPFSTSIGPLVVFVIINGAANGGFFATMPTVVGNTFGSAKVSVAMGMIITGWIGGYLLGAPIAGYLLSASGGIGAPDRVQAYRPAIYYAGSMALGAAGLVLFIRLRLERRLLRRL